MAEPHLPPFQVADVKRAVTAELARLARIERIMGLLLWTLGLLMLTGGFSSFSYWLLENVPALSSLG